MFQDSAAAGAADKEPEELPRIFLQVSNTMPCRVTYPCIWCLSMGRAGVTGRINQLTCDSGIGPWKWGEVLSLQIRH